MPRGRKPDLARRRQAVALRKQGLTLAQIGAEMGVTKQGVDNLLRAGGQKCNDTYRVRCRRCDSVITTGSFQLVHSGPVLCLGCLAATPEAGLGERVRAFRLDAGMTLRELVKRTSLVRSSLSAIERGRSAPKPATVAKLVRVLGAGLVTPRRDGKA